MTKQLVVVVHGVGVRESGTSTELLAAALQTEDLPPHSSDDFRLCEPAKYDKAGLVSTFPAHQRRYRQRDHTGRVVKERVIADFYWGDIAAVRWGAIGAVLAFFRIAMGLGHAIRENARDVFPGASGPNYWARRSAGLAVLAVHGPVVAMNLVLLIGMLVAWSLRGWQPGPDAQLVRDVAITAALSAVVGWALVHYTHTYLSRFLGRWVIAAGLLLALIGGIHLAVPQFADEFSDTMLDHTCSIFAQSPPNDQAGNVTQESSRLDDCLAGFSGVYVLGLWLYALMQLFIILFLVLIIGIAWRSWRLYRLDADRRREILEQGQKLEPGEQVRGVNVTDLATPALGLMLLLWFVLISAIFGVLLFVNVGLLDDFVPQEEIIITALRGLLPALAGLLVLGVLAGRIFWRKHRAFRSRADGSGFRPVDYLNDRNGYAERYRLLVAKSLLVVPLVFLASLVLLYFHFFGWLPAWLTQWIDYLLAEWTGMLMALLALISVGLVSRLREAFLAGLGILTDVLAYLNDFSWADDQLEAEQGSVEKAASKMPRHFVRHDEKDRLRLGGWLLVLLGLKLDPPRRGARRGYWLRDRIHTRLRVFVETFLAKEEPDELVIVAHSQGTVIALDVLCRDGKNWRSQLKHLALVTMGSPARHLYTHYFPSAFRDYASNPVLQPRSAGGEILDAWTNIFRVDDFVGTHIAGDPESNWPQEIPVPANGHTNYWIDRHVLECLRESVQPVGQATESA